MTSVPTTSGEHTIDAAAQALGGSTAKLFWDVLSRALSFSLSILLARRLGAEGFGAFALAWYAAWMSAQATDLGLHLEGLRALSRKFRSRRLASLVIVKLALTVLSLTGLGLLGASGRLTKDAVLLLVLVLAQIAGSWVELAGVVLRSRGLVAREGLLLLALRAGWLLGAVVAITAIPSPGPRHFALGVAAGSVPAVVLAITAAAKLAPRWNLPSRAEIVLLARSALPLAVVAGIAVVYLRADLFLLAALGDAGEVGLFAASFRVFEASFVLSGGLVAGAFPLLARGARGRRRTAVEPAHVVLALLLALAVPVTGLIAGAAGPLLVLLFGEAFRDAAPSLVWLGLAVPAVYVNALTTHLLFAAGRSRVLLVVVALRLVVSVGLDVLWIPEFGARGAAGAVFAAEWSLTVAGVLATRDLLRLKSLVGYGLRRVLRAGDDVEVAGAAAGHGTGRRP